MSRRPWAGWSFTVCLPLFLIWTWLTLSGNTWIRRLDAGLAPRAHPETTTGDVSAAIATLTVPGVVAFTLLVLAGWAARRRLRKLALALAGSAVIGWPLVSLVKDLARRARPASEFAWHHTYSGWSYPSSHATMAVVLGVMVGAATTTTRQPRTVQLFWRVMAGIFVLVVGLDRLLMGAHWASDVVGGWLLGLVISSASLWVAGVRTVPAWELMRPLPPARRGEGHCAVIYNPVKVLDEGLFRRHVRQELVSRGWHEPLFLTTTLDDPGHAMAREALDRRVDRVLVAGGDGTVRVVSSALAGSGVPVGLVPAGTANLLARNLGIPLDEGAALDVALDGDPYAIDLVRVRIDDEAVARDHFTVMAGIGIDAKVMLDTSEELKKAVKSVAYFLAVAQNLQTRPVQARVTIDGKVVSERPSSLMLVGNVGEIQAGLQLFPRAAADDGQLDVLLTAPRGFVGWLAWGFERVYRQLSRRVDSHTGEVVRIEVDEPLPYELDGDTMGEARVFEAQVVPSALTVMLPKRRRR